MRLTIAVSQPVDGLIVKRDATLVGEASWGVAVPVDPGPHTIEATAPHKTSWSSTMNVPATAGSVSVEVPSLVDAPELAPAPSVPAVPMLTASTDAQPQRRLSPAIVTVAAVGIVGVAAGTIFGVKFESAKSQLPGICEKNPMTCDGPSVDRYNMLHSDAERDLTYELIGFGVGGAAVLTAAYLWWRSPPAAPRTSTSIVAWPSVSPDAWGLSMSLRL